MFSQSPGGLVDAHHQMSGMPRSKCYGTVPGPAERIQHQRAWFRGQRFGQGLVRRYIVGSYRGAVCRLQVATNDDCKFGVQVMLIAADRP